MDESLILPACLLGTLPLAYIILRLIFKKSVMVTIGWWVAILVFSCCEMYYIVGKFGFIHLAWALPVQFILGTSIFISFDVRIKRPLVRAINSIVDYSEGQLMKDYEEKRKPKVEIGLLYDAVKRMRKSLIGIVSDVQSNSDDLDEISQKLSISAEDLSKGSTLQASSVQQISATLEEFTMNIKQSTSNAKDTATKTSGVHNKISDVATQTDKTVEANRIIAEKINVINDIATQTNILALNATVESANAGEAGKGFSVVAAEVRKLAEISKRAADEIVELAQHSYSQAENAGSIIKEALPEIGDASSVVKEIYLAGEEQQRGAEEINGAINQLDKVAQNNAESSEIVASSAKELAERSNLLKRQISFFKMTDEELLEEV